MTGSLPTLGVLAGQKGPLAVVTPIHVGPTFGDWRQVRQALLAVRPVRTFFAHRFVAAAALDFHSAPPHTDSVLLEPALETRLVPDFDVEFFLAQLDKQKRVLLFFELLDEKLDFR